MIGDIKLQMQAHALDILTAQHSEQLSTSQTNKDPFQHILHKILQQPNNHQHIKKSLQPSSQIEQPIDKKQTDDIHAIIANVANHYEIDNKLLHAIIQVESNYNPLAKSQAGAQGLMQLMPNTARSLGVTDPYDPAQNIEGGAKYLNQLFKRYNDNLPLALAAYNAGPGNVDKYQGIPPFAETENYVAKVLTLYQA